MIPSSILGQDTQYLLVSLILRIVALKENINEKPTEDGINGSRGRCGHPWNLWILTYYCIVRNMRFLHYLWLSDKVVCEALYVGRVYQTELRLVTLYFE